MRLIQHIIKDKEKLEEMKMKLLEIGYKNYLMFVIAINSGLDISDILKLKVVDLKDKTHIKIVEQNTNKIKMYLINSVLKHELDNFSKLKTDEEYLFRIDNGENTPLSTVEAYRILNIVAEKIGIEEIKPYTLRRTFGYWNYKQNKDIIVLQKMFNHSAPNVTLRYIGINDIF